MSRSRQKTIAFGKSKASKSNRNSFKYFKRPEKGRKNHWRHKFQTLQDYIDYVANDFYLALFGGDMFDRKRKQDYDNFIKENGGIETEELCIKFAKILYNKDRSK